MQVHSEANQRWKSQLEEFRQSNSYKELLGTDGEPIEFEWNIFPGLTSLEISQKIRKDLKVQNNEPEKFEDRIIVVSMLNDIDWTRRGNSEQCVSNSEIVKNCAKRFSRGHWAFHGLVSEKKWYGNQSYPQEGKWQATAGQMVERFEESGHPVFKSVSPLARGILRRKNNKETIHFTADASNTEMLFSHDSLSKSAQCPRSSLKLE